MSSTVVPPRGDSPPDQTGLITDIICEKLRWGMGRHRRHTQREDSGSSSFSQEGSRLSLSRSSRLSRSPSPSRRRRSQFSASHVTTALPVDDASSTLRVAVAWHNGSSACSSSCVAVDSSSTFSHGRWPRCPVASSRRARPHVHRQSDRCVRVYILQIGRSPSISRTHTWMSRSIPDHSGTSGWLHR